MLQAQHMRILLPVLGLFAFIGLLAHDAAAQSRGSVLSRIDELEDRLQRLETTAPANPNTTTSPAPSASGGQAQIAISSFQEELRQLRGDIEELSHTQRRQSEQIEQLSREIDLRFSQMTPASAEMPVSPPEAPVAPPETPVLGTTQTTPAEAPAEPTDESDDNSAAPPGEAYKAAFETLNSGDYAAAEQLFGAFINRYPEHSLIGNAHYWLGETYYVQERFETAADEFRKGFQAMPQGPKAPDNLLRLGMTLGVLERKDEACIIFKQLTQKYADQSKAALRKANHERDKLGCQ